MLKIMQEALLSHNPTKRELNLLPDSPTRWNSTVDMLKHLLDLMPAIHATVIDAGANTCVKSLEALVERLIISLDPFKCLTTQLAPSPFFLA